MESENQDLKGAVIENLGERRADDLRRASALLGSLGRTSSEAAILEAIHSEYQDLESIEALFRCAERLHDEKLARSTFSKLEAALVRSGNTGRLPELGERRLRFLNSGAGPKPRIAGIMDEFTATNFAPECIYLPLYPDRAKTQIAEFKPEFVFVESAWNGSGGVWNKQVSNASIPLQDMLRYCRRVGVPTVFWNKEDPVHFSVFLDTARLCDFIFTTDIDCIQAYKHELGHDKVYFLPFAAQPQTHNPIATLERKNAFNFAGSYYIRYPQRQRDFAALMEAARSLLPIDIYDRNHGKGQSQWEFPERYRDMILGSLPFTEIDKAYKGYRYGINVNTVKYSQSMYARRVFELMASNTIVVSNFSRGMRLMFGDLVISSDNSRQLATRLLPLIEDDLYYRKFRLLALRKVLREHTYADRLAEIRSIIFDSPKRLLPPRIAMLAKASTKEEAQQITASFSRQQHPLKHLFMLDISGGLTEESSNISVFNDTNSLLNSLFFEGNRFALCGVLHPKDHYGENYLTDLALASRFGDADGFGKGCHFEMIEKDTPRLSEEELRYSPCRSLSLRMGLVGFSKITEDVVLSVLADPDLSIIKNIDFLSIDEFNYCKEGNTCDSVSKICDDVELPFQGMETPPLFELAHRIKPSKPRTTERRDGIPTIKAIEFLKRSSVSKGSPLEMRMRDGMLNVSRKVSFGQSASYLWMPKRYERSALNLKTQSSVYFDMQHSLAKAGLAFKYYNENGEKIGHSILNSAGRHFLAIPNECTHVRFGLRLVGTGTLTIGDIAFGGKIALPPAIIGASDTLVVTKQYPAYQDLYRYGFLHSRIRAYRATGKSVDIFRIGGDPEQNFDEFENIDIANGDAQLLSDTLSTGRYAQVLVHLLDRQMWRTIKPFLEYTKVVIWIHGAEIQHWRRRSFEFSSMSTEEITQKKKRSEDYLDLWREVFSENNPNMHFVFVSQSLFEEAAEDVGVSPHRDRYSIIHNYVDGGLFPYHKKSVEQRLKVFSVRSFSSAKYGNDLTVAAIKELSKRSFFSDLTFTLVGSGPLFKPLTDPIAGLPNVRLHERFLTHSEIAEFQKTHGVFLNPTRWDSQGVSRDEAMSSGLVPISNEVSAVPEFVDETCGILVPEEDPIALADAIERLYHDPDLFLSLSKNAAMRVREQSGFEQTICRELTLMSEI